MLVALQVFSVLAYHWKHWLQSLRCRWYNHNYNWPRARKHNSCSWYVWLYKFLSSCFYAFFPLLILVKQVLSVIKKRAPEKCVNKEEWLFRSCSIQLTVFLWNPETKFSDIEAELSALSIVFFPQIILSSRTSGKIIRKTFSCKSLVMSTKI